MLKETETEPTWTKTLLAPDREVPREAARGHAVQNCRIVAKAAADLMRTGAAGPSPERVTRYKRAADELRARIGEDVTASAGGSASLVEVDAMELLLGVCDRARDWAEARNVALIVHPSARPARVRARERELAEALFNLVANAIEATTPGYPVFASAAATSEGNLLWEVQDSGEGMSPDVLAWLGEPFRTTRHGGQGLGIAIARAIVEAHGGMLSFESAPGLGTTASAWTPAALA
jgi:two-component system, NtrC family, sensor histidine kinase AtoS